MNQAQDLDEVERIVDRLKVLLSDRHPGLFSWSMMYGQAMSDLLKAWGIEENL